MYLDSTLMDSLFRDPAQRELEMYTFLMIVVITHEIAHCFTGYLTGNPRHGTPDNASVEGQDGGEAGFALEFAIFGGAREMWDTPAAGLDQPGVPYVCADYYHDTLGRKVSSRYIRRFIDRTGAIPLPIELSSADQPINRYQLWDAGYVLMTTIRQEAYAEAAQEAQAAQAAQEAHRTARRHMSISHQPAPTSGSNAPRAVPPPPGKPPAPSSSRPLVSSGAPKPTPATSSQRLANPQAWQGPPGPAGMQAPHKAKPSQARKLPPGGKPPAASQARLGPASTSKPIATPRQGLQLPIRPGQRQSGAVMKPKSQQGSMYQGR